MEETPIAGTNPQVFMRISTIDRIGGFNQTGNRQLWEIRAESSVTAIEFSFKGAFSLKAFP
jgi:hypothetical protein